MKEYNHAIECCSKVLTDYDPQCVKALYRRAQTRLMPLSSTTTDQISAVDDLKQANRLDPDNTSVRALLHKTIEELQRQREKDKKQYHGLFERDTERETEREGDRDKTNRADTTSSSSTPSIDLSWKDIDTVLTKLDDEIDRVRVKLEHRMIKHKGGTVSKEGLVRDEEVKELSSELQRLLEKKKDLQDTLEKANLPHRGGGTTNSSSSRDSDMYDNPTNEMIDEAKKQGIDLTDPRYVYLCLYM